MSYPTVSCKLIGIHGHAGSGKDTVADYIRFTRENTWKIPFARALKEACVRLFGMPLESFHELELKEAVHPYWNISPRQAAQFFGTEMVRETLPRLLPTIGSNFWIHRLAMTLNGLDESMPYDSDDVVVIPDVRFQNEYDWIIANGGIIIHLTRPGADGIVGIPSHASEAGILHTCPERTYPLSNQGSLDDLHAKVEDILTEANVYPFDNPDSF